MLTPADFGYVAMAAVVTELAALLGAFGLTNLLIQRRATNRLQLDTVFWASLGVGVVSAGIVVLLSFTSGLLFADPKVGELLRVLSLNFIISALTAVPWVVLSRMMRFQVDFYIQLVVLVCRTAVAIVLAWFGWGLWSLVAGSITGTAINAVLGLVVVRYWPRFRFHWPVLSKNWRTSGGYLGNTMLHYVNTNLDLLLIGRSLGATSLGYYQNARFLTDEIRGRIAMPIQQVLFPAFSALQTDRAAFQALVLRAGRLLAAVVVPIGFGVSANADLLVQALYGPQWLAMVPVLSMFGLSGALRAATAIASPIFNAMNRVGLAFRYNLICSVLLFVAVAVTVPWGIEAVAVGMTLAMLYTLVSMHAAFRLIGLGLVDLIGVLGPSALAAIIMWVAIWLTPASAEALGVPMSGLLLAVQLLLQVAVGAAVYGLCVLSFSSALRGDLWEFVARLGWCTRVGFSNDKR